MKLTGIKEGDVVRLDGDPSLWLVRGKEGRTLSLTIPRSSATRRAKGAEVVEAWRKVRTRTRGSA